MMLASLRAIIYHKAAKDVHYAETPRELNSMLAIKTRRAQTRAEHYPAESPSSVSDVVADFRRSLPPAFAPPVQRKVKEGKKEDGSVYYYSDMDVDSSGNPIHIFDSHYEAKLYDNYFLKTTRLPTLYTYTHTSRGAQINSMGFPQGPHTYGHAAVKAGLNKAMKGQKLIHIFTGQCLVPDDWKALVEQKIGAELSEDAQDELGLRLLRAYNDYTMIYENAVKAIKNGESSLAEFYIARLMQLHPSATYAWGTTAKELPSTIRKRKRLTKGKLS